MTECIPKSSFYEAYRIGSEDDWPDWVECVVVDCYGRYEVALSTGSRMANGGDWCVKTPMGIAVMSDAVFREMFTVIDDECAY